MDGSSSLPAGAERPRREVLVWLRWVLANVVGEAVGFGLGMSAAFAITMPFERPEGVLLVLAMFVEILVFGVVEGLFVGLAQHWVLKPLLPALRRSAWVKATIPGAVVAWGAGMAIGNYAGDQLASALGGSWLIGGLLIGMLAGAILSAFQWLALGQVARRAWVWVPAHSVAWAVGMLIAFAGIGTISGDSPMLTVLGTSAGIGVGMGIAVAALTGLALLWVLRGEE